MNRVSLKDSCRYVHAIVGKLLEILDGIERRSPTTKEPLLVSFTQITQSTPFSLSREPVLL